MTDRKLIVLLVTALLVASFVVSTYSVTEINGSRTVGVDVAGDGEQSYLGTEVHSPRLPNGHHDGVPILTLRHNLGHDRDLRVAATVSGDSNRTTPPNVRADPPVEVLGIGEEATLTVPVDCGRNKVNTEVFTVTVTVDGSKTSMDFTQEVTLTCTGEPNEGQSGADAGP